MTRRALTIIMVGSLGLALGALAGYSYGHRAGRGAMCFETAVNTPDTQGRTLASTLLRRPGARSDYSFWGTDCTISIGFLEEGRLVGGRWRFEPARARLWADSPEGEQLFPAGGRWERPGTL